MAGMNTITAKPSNPTTMQTITETVAPAAPRAHSRKKVVLITLAVVLGCAGIAAATGALWVKHTFYPSPIQPVSLTATEKAEFDNKLQVLGNPAAIPADEANRTLLISEREVNAYLAQQQLGESQCR
jgi:hypothetical protein